MLSSDDESAVSSMPLEPEHHYPDRAEPPVIPTAPVSEIFSSLQGEGLHVGERQIFIRFAGCPWRCRYCDTPDSLSEEGHPVLTVHDTLRRVQDLQKERDHRSVSLTGGEPLLRSDFLAALIPPLKDLGLFIPLETSATHPHLFEKIADWCDVVAADIKLPSAIGRPFWGEHEAFFRLAGSRAFAKMVLTSATSDDELAETVRLLRSLDPVPPLVLQPVTPIPDLLFRLQDAQSATPPYVRPPSPHRVAVIMDYARQRLPLVKLVAQMHPIWGLP